METITSKIGGEIVTKQVEENLFSTTYWSFDDEILGGPIYAETEKEAKKNHVKMLDKHTSL